MKIERQLTKKMHNLFGEDFKFTKGPLHCHTQNSVDDGFSTEADLCAVSAEKGAEATAITDHGTVMGWDDFDDALKTLNEKRQEEGLAEIKGVFGAEVYLRDPVTDANSHLVVYALNDDGMLDIRQAMSHGIIVGGSAVKEDDENEEEDDGIVCLTDETLEYLRGGNVIATSACIGGVFGSIVLYNDKINRKIAKLLSEIDALTPALEAYQKAKADFEQADERFSILRAEVSEAKAASKKSFTGKQKQLDSMKKKLDKASMLFDKFLEDGKDATAKSLRVALAQLEVTVEDCDEFQNGIEEAQMKYNQRQAQLQSEIKRMKELASTVEAKTTAQEEAKLVRAEAKAVLDTCAKDVTKIENRKAKINELEATKLTKEQSNELFQNRLAKMKEIFGNNFYIEVQNHGLESEQKIYSWLAKVARKHKIPIVAANDAHVARNSSDDVAARQIRRSCRFKRWTKPTEDITEYYLKNDRELALALYQILPEDVVIEAMTNVSKIIERCNASIEKGSHAPKAKDVADVKDAIINLARANINAKYGAKWSTKHEERFNYEIGIIDSMGFNDYFLITWDILNIARQIGGLSYDKLYELKASMNDFTLDELLAYLKQHNTEPNLSVGLGRGSGAGSIVCYLLGITNIDPFEYDLIFERFLNPERISMPDIDSDFRSDIKDVLLVYLKKKYGERAIAQILTKSYLQGKSAIDKVVMILGSRDGVDYRYIADRLKKKSGVDFDKPLAQNRDALLSGADSAIEKEIVETAILMDGNLDHTGLHAAGVIISDNDDLAEYIPIAWDAGSETWKTQCDMVQCEGKHGLLKMDILLLKTLDIVTYALRLIKQNHPDVEIDIENLPFEEEVFKKIYATGDTKGVFQFESGGMIKFLRQLQPTCIEDIIAANAMYRPGPMDSIPDYVNAKHSGKIIYDCPELEPILKETYGIIIYQEQVMRIFRDLAGFSLGRSDLVRRAMSKKKMKALEAERENFVNGNEKEGIHGCVALGIKPEVAEKIFDRMLAFAAYAFNKSHAAAYSVTSYMTAWLKYHYPAEFYCAALNHVNAQKEIPSIIADAKKHKIKVLKPDINKSMANFSTENGHVRFGLKFLANAKSRANAVVDYRESGYKSFKEFIQSRPGKQMAEAAIYSGACDAYIGNDPDRRNSLIQAYEELSVLYDAIVNAESKVELATTEDAKLKATTALETLKQKWDLFECPNPPRLALMERLGKEQEYTSVYFSADPLDGFTIDTTFYKDIDSLEDGEVAWIAASMSDKKALKTKKDALPMMSGRLTDRSGTISCIIFPKAYAKLVDKLDSVMGFQGKMSANGDEESQFIISDIKTLPQKTKRIVVWFDDFNATKAILKAGAVSRSEGFEAWLGGTNSKLYPTGVHVTEEYVKENNLKYTIKS